MAYDVFDRDFDADYADMPPNVRSLLLMLDKRFLMLESAATGNVDAFFDALGAFEEAKRNMKIVWGIE